MPLELKRLELLRVFKPTYPSVMEVDRQIATLQQAIDAAKASPVVEETTNRHPTHDYVETELAKNRSELAAMQARVARVYVDPALIEYSVRLANATRRPDLEMSLRGNAANLSAAPSAWHARDERVRAVVQRTRKPYAHAIGG